MRLGKAGIAFPAWAVPVLASVKTPHEEFEGNSLVLAQLLKLPVIVGWKVVLELLVFIIFFLCNLFVHSAQLFGYSPISFNLLHKFNLIGDEIFIVFVRNSFGEILGVEAASQQRHRVMNVANGEVKMHSLINSKSLPSKFLRNRVQLAFHLRA